jgi:hypothetical protein
MPNLKEGKTMVSRFLIVIFFIFCLVDVVHADQFQFVHSETGALIANTRVYLNNAPYGYTDLYGRINISVAAGTHSCTVEFMGRKLSKAIKITGSTQLRIERF